jgi:hypothetical protein
MPCIGGYHRQLHNCAVLRQPLLSVRECQVFGYRSNERLSDFRTARSPQRRGEGEKAARGGAAGHRFPWTDTDNITHSKAHLHRMGMDSMIWQAMYMIGAMISGTAVITVTVREATRVGLILAAPVCCGVVALATTRKVRGALIATATRLTAATAATLAGAFVACVLEVSGSGERSDKQARSGRRKE